MQGSITEPLAIHTLAQALKSSSLQSSGWSNLHAGSRSESDDISVNGAGEPPAAKKVKQCSPTSAELKPADVKGTFHPSGPKFLNVWLWKHYKLSPCANCDKWALCALCQKGGETVWIPRSDGSTTRMKKHLIDVHNSQVPGYSSFQCAL